VRVTATAAATLRQLPRIPLAIPPRIRRRLLLALVLALMLFGVYRFWFRDSSFVTVQHVTVTGLTTKDAARIRTALTAAAHDMTTLNVHRSALQGAVGGFPVVKDVVVTPEFPHGLKVRVIEERPVATLAVGGEHLLLAPDGTVLRGITAGRHLPLIRTAGSVPQDRLTDGVPLTALHVVAAAPAALALRISSVGHGKTRGIVVRLNNGPPLIFGNDHRATAKWAGAAAVLADPSSKGASYVDLRVPDRPVAGGLAASTLAPLTSTGSDASGQSNSQIVPATTGPTAASPTSGTPTPVTPVNPQP
jgi:cell division protein FtsQ